MREAAPQMTPLARSAADPEAFVAFYDRHARTVLVFFTRRTFEPEVARDLTAETFAQAFKDRARFRGTSEDDAAAWLFGIARNLLAGFLRRGGVERGATRRLGIEVPPLEPDEYVRIEQLASLTELRGAVGAAFDALSERQRDALRLRVVEELSYREVAERLRITEATARARVARGLRALGEALDADPVLLEHRA